MVGDVGEMAMVRDEGTVGVTVQVATTEKGQLAESVEKGGCHSSMPTMHDTYSLLPKPLHTNIWKKYPRLGVRDSSH